MIATPIITPDLAAILAYQNEDVICRFMENFAVTEEEALDIFQETKKFLYLGSFGPIFISGDMLMLDEMWHNFVLFTREYHWFCKEHFGSYRHHAPSTKAEKEENKRRQQEEPQVLAKEFRDRLEELMSLVYDHLGAETLVKWFETYPQKYSEPQLKALMK